METLKKKISKSNWLKITKDVILCTKCLKNEKLELSEKVHDFENNCLMLFKKGQCGNDIRSASGDLRCIGSVNVSKFYNKKIFYYKAIKIETPVNEYLNFWWI